MNFKFVCNFLAPLIYEQMHDILINFVVFMLIVRNNLIAAFPAHLYFHFEFTLALPIYVFDIDRNFHPFLLLSHILIVCL